MPRYFFETDDGDVFDHDPEGIDLADDRQARHQALRSLRDMAHDLFDQSDGRTFVSTVRNEGGEIIYSATMSVTGRWHVAKIIPFPSQ